MLRAAVILLTLGLALAVADNVLRFKSEDGPPRSEAETEQQAPEGQAENHLNAADQQRPMEDPKYKLSYADYKVTWESFKKDHNKQYATKDEEEKRYTIFLETVKRIESHNLKYHNGETSFYLDINHFSDLTLGEYGAMLGSGSSQRAPGNAVCDDYYPEEGEMADSIDWRAKGYVSSVKDQGGCSACYAFTAAGAIEGQWFQYSGNLFNLSEQQLIDCSGNFTNEGCRGGYVDTSFKYLINAGGLVTEEEYSFKAKQGNCTFDKSKAVANISSCFNVRPARNESVLQAVVYNIGPIAVSISSHNYLFMSYKGGIFDNENCLKYRDHAVLVVGYDREGSQDYWIVKNSWGAAWGENGYVRMTRNKNNQCAIASEAFFPRV